MSVVPSISLVNVASNEKHCLNSTESVIGRGWLNCNDKRISRNHGVLKIISPNSVAVASTHQNSMFFRKKNNTEVNQIQQNNEVNLFVGDSFGLLVDEFWFSIQPSDKDNDVIDGLYAHSTQSNANYSGAPTSSGIKRRSSSDSEPDSTNKKVKTEPTEFQDEATNEVANEANGLSNGDLDTTISTDNSNEMPSTSASSAIPQTENDSTVADRPIKAEPVDSDEIQSMPSVKTEPSSQEANVDSTMTHTPFTIKSEVKTEPTDNENNDDAGGATTSSGNTHQPPQRECCRYGVRCYRRNPAHRASEAHPGDEDYRLPDYPDPPLGAAPCPYLDRCYRRNPTHFQQFSHKATWRTDSSGKEGYEATAKTPKRTATTTANAATNDNDDSEDDPYATDDDSDADYQGGGSSDSDDYDQDTNDGADD